jgi:hypothetical protein
VTSPVGKFPLGGLCPLASATSMPILEGHCVPKHTRALQLRAAGDR